MNACYVYYRVRADAQAQAARAVADILSHLRGTTGVQGRWMHKLHEPLLWMEIYEDIGDPRPFADSLAKAVHASHIDAALQPDSARKEEYFVSCA